MGHLALCPETGGPQIDPHGRCSDPSFFAAGNMLRPVETAGWCFDEGRRIGKALAQDLRSGLPGPRDSIDICVQRPLKYAMPQQLPVSATRSPLEHLQLRVLEATRCELCVEQGGKLPWHRRGRFLPERRILIPLAALRPNGGGALSISLHPR